MGTFSCSINNNAKRNSTQAKSFFGEANSGLAKAFVIQNGGNDVGYDVLGFAYPIKNQSAFNDYFKRISFRDHLGRNGTGRVIAELQKKGIQVINLKAESASKFGSLGDTYALKTPDEKILALLQGVETDSKGNILSYQQINYVNDGQAIMANEYRVIDPNLLSVRSGYSEYVDIQQTNFVINKLQELGIDVVISNVVPINNTEATRYTLLKQITNKQIYGFYDKVSGKIHLTQDGLKPEIAIHEYTHLFCKVLQERFAEDFEKLVTHILDPANPEYEYIQDIIRRHPEINKITNKYDRVSEILAYATQEYVKNKNHNTKFQTFLYKFWSLVKNFLGIDPKMSIEEFSQLTLATLFNGDTTSSNNETQATLNNNAILSSFRHNIEDYVKSIKESAPKTSLDTANNIITDANKLIDEVEEKYGDLKYVPRTNNPSKLYERLKTVVKSQFPVASEEFINWYTKYLKARLYTPNFIQSFGIDWTASDFKPDANMAASFDENGEPQLWVHGTNVIFETINPNHRRNRGQVAIKLESTWQEQVKNKKDLEGTFHIKNGEEFRVYIPYNKNTKTYNYNEITFIDSDENEFQPYINLKKKPLDLKKINEASFINLINPINAFQATLDLEYGQKWGDLQVTLNTANDLFKSLFYVKNEQLSSATQKLNEKLSNYDLVIKPILVETKSGVKTRLAVTTNDGNALSYEELQNTLKDSTLIHLFTKGPVKEQNGQNYICITKSIPPNINIANFEDKLKNIETIFTELVDTNEQKDAIKSKFAKGKGILMPFFLSVQSNEASQLTLDPNTQLSWKSEAIQNSGQSRQANEESWITRDTDIVYAPDNTIQEDLGVDKYTRILRVKNGAQKYLLSPFNNGLFSMTDANIIGTVYEGSEQGLYDDPNFRKASGFWKIQNSEVVIIEDNEEKNITSLDLAENDVPIYIYTENEEDREPNKFNTKTGELEFRSSTSNSAVIRSGRNNPILNECIYPITVQQHRGKELKNLYSDSNFDTIKQVIDADFKQIQLAIQREWARGKNPVLIFPKNGVFGGNISQINPQRTPRLYYYYLEKLKSLKEYLNIRSNTPIIDESAPESNFLFSGQNLEQSKQTDRLSSEEKDVLGLLTYQYTIEGLSKEEIKARYLGYLSGNKQDKAIARKMLELIQIRRAQLHQLGKDFGKEIRYPNGVMNWNAYLQGIDLRKEIESEQDIVGTNFTQLIDYKVDPAEIIMPKLYRTKFKLGNRSITDIDLDYFDRANAYYSCPAKPIIDGKVMDGIPVDIFVRCHNRAFSIAVVPEISSANKGDFTRSVTPVISEDGWRLDKAGKKMYKLPDDPTTYSIKANAKGEEIIFLRQTEDYEKNISHIVNTTENIVSTQGFFDNITLTEDMIDLLIKNNLINTNNNQLEKIDTKKQSPEEIRAILKDIYQLQEKYYRNDLKNTLYNSFMQTLRVISVRIPTQAFQSIMAAKVVAFTNDELNNVFVNRWQFWLQGSDLDIDKTYIMGADISDQGTYNHWSPLADFTTEERSKISMELPIPNHKYIATKQSYYKAPKNSDIIIADDITAGQEDAGIIAGYVHDYMNSYAKSDVIIAELVKKYNIKDSLQQQRKSIRLKIKQLLLKHIDLKGTFNISQVNPEILNKKQYRLLISDLNYHNAHKVTDAEARNLIQTRIIKTSLDERNFKASYSPIDVAMELFKDELKKVEDANAQSRNLDDGISVYEMQYNNSVGKQDVGIMANGLKAFFALTQYFNQHKRDPNFISSARFFLSNLPSVNGEMRKCCVISDIQFETEAIRALNKALSNFLPRGQKQALYNTSDDASLLISSLVSLATDNAKELALGKMNASINLACMHLLLVVMGYTAEEVIKITTSPEFKELTDAIAGSSFITEDTRVSNILDNLIYKYKKVGQAAKAKKFQDFKYLYDCAQEMSSIAKLAAVNQGAKVDEIKTYSFLSNFENLIGNLDLPYNVLFIDGKIEFRKFDKDLGEFIPISIDEVIKANTNLSQVTPELRKWYQTKCNKVIEYWKKFGQIHKIDALKYFEDIEYREAVVATYDLYKKCFNPFDVINNLPHFYEMLHAYTVSAKTIMQISSKASTVLPQVKTIYSIMNKFLIRYIKEPVVDDDNNPIEDINGNPIVKRIELIPYQSFSDEIYNKGYKFFNDYILSAWIQQFGDNYEITLNSPEITDSGITYTKEVISLKTNEGLRKFVDFVVFDLIPALRVKYPNNQFLKSLVLNVKKKKQGLILPKFNFNFDITNPSVSDQSKAFQVCKDFADLMLGEFGNHPLVLKDVFGSSVKSSLLGNTKTDNLPVGELIYFFNEIITQNSGYSPLSRAFDQYLQRIGQNSIAKQLGDVALQMDNGTLPKIEFDPALFTAFCYQNQLRSKMDGIADFGDSKINLKDFLLFNLYNNKVIESKQEVAKYTEQFIQGINNNIIQIGQNDDGQWKLYIPNTPDKIDLNINSAESITLDAILEALSTHIITEGSSKKLKNLVTRASQIQKEIRSKHAAKAHETLAVYKRFKERLTNLGLEVQIDHNLPPNVNGFVENGVIHLNARSSITTTPVHELMHIVFAVMKNEDYAKFNKIMSKFLKNNNVAQQLLSEVQNNSKYENLVENDQIEEVFCRMLEDLVNGKDDGFSDQLLDGISKDISMYIGKTFGINAPTNFIEFLGFTIAELVTTNSPIFIKAQMQTTGYLENRLKVIESAKITKFLEKMVADKLLEKTEC